MAVPWLPGKIVGQAAFTKVLLNPIKSSLLKWSTEVVSPNCGWTELVEANERRVSRRYKMDLAIKLRVSDGSTMSEWRAGKTCDLSTGGVVFECHDPFPMNARLEMVIDWPSKNDDLHPICL